MRSLALVTIAAFAVACSFSPGRYSDVQPPPTDAQNGGSVDPDTTPPSPIKVRRLDVADAQVVGSHTDFPLLVSITDTWLKSVAHGGDVQSDSAFDLYFSLDKAGSMRLAHEIEVYTPTTGRLVAWVKVPTLDTETSLFLHYGDASMTTDQSTPAQVWTNGYELVVHLNGTGDATGKATSVPGNGNVRIEDGLIGVSREYDGATGYSNAQSGTAVDDVFENGGTVEAWFKPNSAGAGGFGRIFDKSEWGVWFDATGAASFYHSSTQSNYQGVWAFPTLANAFGNWHHLAVTYDQSSASSDPDAVIDGADVSVDETDQPNGSITSDALHDLVIGNRSDLQRGFDGMLDEVRASSVIRSDDWLTTQFHNQSSPSTFYTVSAPL